jgi:stage II sporulation protein D
MLTGLVKKSICTLSVVFLFCITANARPVRISLYNNSLVQSIIVSAYNGTLTAFQSGQTLFTVADGKAVYITLYNGKLLVSNIDGFIGAYGKLSIQGADSSVVVRLKPASPQLESRNYEETVLLRAETDRIRIFNSIDEERYIAGVIEAEVGTGREPEFYKAKAVICRSYLYRHINRHEPEGFHLCDEVHCQAYKGQCRHSELIKSSVFDTKGIILTDREDSQPILATYHSNCGGETESARNAWQNDLPYLIPVADRFCTLQPNARWQKKITLDEWISYLVKNGFKPDPHIVVDFSFQQVHRVPDYTVNDFSLPVKQIRTDWQLRSTFFSVSVEDDSVLLDGKGYGHGVGLCQEGAMEMGRQGYSYGEIISHYYKYVNLVPVSALKIKMPEFD